MAATAGRGLYLFVAVVMMMYIYSASTLLYTLALEYQLCVELYYF